jgi:hypothetical protein
LAIPGQEAVKLDIRAKVRVGEKTSRGLPTSVDHFVSEDSEVPDGSVALVIEFAHPEPEDAFRTGMEWWKGKLQVCYSTDGGSDPTAFRVSSIKNLPNFLDADDEIRGKPVGQGRTPIKCRFRQCPHFGSNADNKECRVKGRLTFLMSGGRTDSALQFETKGWETIEGITGTLATCRRSGPLNTPGRRFVLSVEIKQKGNKKFPVVSVAEMKEDTPVVVDEAVIPLADALVALRGSVDRPDEDALIKLKICDVLDITHAGWRDDSAFVAAMAARVQEIGVGGAARGLLSRYEVALAV